MSNIFSKKDKRFKGKNSLNEIKDAYIELINERIHDENDKLKVFNKNGIYLPLKKIGKNTSNEKNIRANNRMALEWNNVASQAVEWMPPEHIRELKRTEIQEPLIEIYKTGNPIGNLYKKWIE